MPTRGVSKWAIGGPMIEWCDRHGLDATRIVDSPDAFTVRRVANSAMCNLEQEQMLVEAWVIQGEPADLKPGQQWRARDDWLEVLESRVVDSKPPLNPEWVALFGEKAAWR